MKKQYVYIGQYYHIKNKELPLDFKFGVTDDLDQREYSLGRTKSPIKYMILKAWELPSNVKREKVEKMIALVFDEHKYDGCEWYDVDGETFQGKIKELFEIISDMIDDINFTFIEVDLNNNSDGDVVEKEIEKEIRTGKKAPWTNLEVNIDGNLIKCDSAKSTYGKAIEIVLKCVDPVQLSIDFPRIFKLNKEDYPEYKRSSLLKIGEFYLDTYTNTAQKKREISNIIKKYNIDGEVSIIS
jgi:hypothetical protein